MPSPTDEPSPGESLAGRRLVVTRSAFESGRLAERLASLGAEVDVVPLIASAPPDDDGAALAAALDDAVGGDVDWMVVTSPTGARRVVEMLAGRRLATRVCAVGPGTAEVLESVGVPVDLVPARHVGEGIADEFPDAPPTPPAQGSAGPGRSLRVVVVRAAVARDVVPDALTAKGWSVDVVASHRTVSASVSSEARAALARADAATLTSSSTATALADVAVTHPDVALPPVVCIGPVTAATAAARGLETLAVADPHSLDGLVDAVVAALGAPGAAAVSGEGGSGVGS